MGLPPIWLCFFFLLLITKLLKHCLLPPTHPKDAAVISISRVAHIITFTSQAAFEDGLFQFEMKLQTSDDRWRNSGIEIFFLKRRTTDGECLEVLERG